MKSGAGWGRGIVKNVGSLTTLYARAGESLRKSGGSGKLESLGKNRSYQGYMIEVTVMRKG